MNFCRKAFLTTAFLVILLSCRSSSQEEYLQNLPYELILSEALQNFTILPYIESYINLTSLNSLNSTAHTTAAQKEPQMSKICKDAFLHLINHFINSTQFWNMVLMSGKGLNDFGDYDACNNSPESRYITFQINDLPVLVDIGLCVPMQCHPHDFLFLNPLLAETLENMVHTKEREGSPMDQYHILKESIIFIDPVKETQEKGYIGVGFVMTIGYMIIALLFVIYASFHDGKRRKELRNWEKLKDERDKMAESLRQPSLYVPGSEISEGSMSSRSMLSEGSMRKEALQEGEGSISLTAENLEKDIFSSPPRETKLDTICNCCSLIRNYNSLFFGKNTVDPNTDVLNGIRTMCLIWVVWGHTYFNTIFMQVQNIDQIIEFDKQFYFATIASASYVVDIFFYLTAFLACYGMYYAVASRKFNLGIIYLHRYLRLLPLYFVCFLFDTNVLPLMQSGPVYNKMYVKAENCTKWWWTHFLYINNFKQFFISNFTEAYGCYGVTWYLPNDFQFFLLAPLLMLIYRKKSKIAGLVVILAIFIISCIIQAILSVHYHLAIDTMKFNQHYFDDYYYTPYCRINPFLVGAIVGIAYASYKDDKCKDKFKDFAHLTQRSRVLRYCLYGFGFFLVFWLIFLNYFQVNYPEFFPQWVDTIHLIFSRPLIAVGIGMVSYPILVGKGKLVLAFMGHPFCNTLAKLGYGIYMIHILFLELRAYSIKKAFYLRNYSIVINFFGFLLMTVVMAAIISLIYEVPWSNIEKTFLLGQKKGKQKPPPAVEMKEKTAPDEEQCLIKEEKTENQ